jgi:hypothetical protein
MYKDILEPEKYYYMGSYLKPFYSCKPCNMTWTEHNGDKVELCPLCKKESHVMYAPITFTQDVKYTATSC